MTLKLIAIGALGHMLGPTAKHLEHSDSAQFLRFLDRGKQGERRDKFRADWNTHGASSVLSLAELVGDGNFDGVVICAGKNGDDYKIFRELVPLLAKQTTQKRYFILQLSTVSCAFVKASHDYCLNHNIDYANYPLTGGAKGAAAATMLILACGSKSLYQRLENFLQVIGKPKYFGEKIEMAAAIKLIGHVMVFHGLLGMSLAISLHKQVSDCDQLGADQIDAFDFLNKGAGGTNQWEFAIKPGIMDSNWSHGFLLAHAAIDIIYTIQLMLEYNLPETLCLPLIEVSLLLSYLLNKYPQEELATQSLTRLIANTSKIVLDHYLQKHITTDIPEALEHCIFQLPERLRQSLMPQVRYTQSV